MKRRYKNETKEFEYKREIEDDESPSLEFKDMESGKFYEVYNTKNKVYYYIKVTEIREKDFMYYTYKPKKKKLLKKEEYLFMSNWFNGIWIVRKWSSKTGVVR